MLFFVLTLNFRAAIRMEASDSRRWKNIICRVRRNIQNLNTRFPYKQQQQQNESRFLELLLLLLLSLKKWFLNANEFSSLTIHFSFDFNVSIKSSHLNKKTSYTDPRLAFYKAPSSEMRRSNSSKDSGSFSGHMSTRAYVKAERPVIDEYSTASQIVQNKDLSGQCAIVTGANKGVGKCIKRVFCLYTPYIFH